MSPRASVRRPPIGHIIVFVLGLANGSAAQFLPTRSPITPNPTPPTPAPTYLAAKLATCLVCSSGSVLNAEGMCEVCPVGKHANPVTGHCELCPLGAVPNNDQSLCSECPLGTTSQYGDSICSSCPSGTISLRGDSACTICRAGSIPTLNKSSCQRCPTGRFSKPGDVFCGECGNGSVPTQAQDACEVCAAGKFAVSLDTECSSCLVGKVSFFNQSSMCVTCPLGSVPSFDNKFCQRCSDGSIASYVDSSCTLCGDGFVPNLARDACTMCDAGTFSLRGDESCRPCPADTYSNHSGSATCFSCPIGLLSDTGSTACYRCHKGSIPRLGGDCALCPPGQYAAAGALQCSPCGVGTFSTNGSSKCDACPDGKIPSLDRASCMLCPQGRWSTGLSCDFCLEGFIVNSNQTRCEPCPPGFKAVRGELTCSACSIGRSSGVGSSSCFRCSSGTYSSPEGAVCRRCPPGSKSTLDQSGCEVCGDGMYSLVAGSECMSCGAGRVPSENRTYCLNCPAGRFSLMGSQSCIPCPVNTISLRERSPTCLPCSPGKIQSQSGQTECTSCTKDAIAVEGQGCVPCSPNSFPLQDSLDCQCQAGYYQFNESEFGSQKSCLKCGIGYFCPGGKDRFACGTNSSTIIENSKSVEDCQCKAGYYGTASDSFKPCVQCKPGTFKSYVGNWDHTDECPGVCRPFFTTENAATSDDACHCLQGYYYKALGTTLGGGTCEKCPRIGVNCPGFVPNSSLGIHAPPTSLEGYYMTGPARAEPCTIVLETGKSVCLAGFPYGATQPCERGHTGIMCGACETGWSRDFYGNPCQECNIDSDWAIFGRILVLNCDAILKSAWSMYLARRAIENTITSENYDSILWRIGAQWMAVLGLVRYLDLSNMKIFAVDSISKEAKPSDEDSRAFGIGRLAWPHWFNDVYSKMMSFEGTLPFLSSAQMAIECIAERQSGHNMKMIAPTIWWLCYPIVQGIYIFLLALFVAWVMYPISEYLYRSSHTRITEALIEQGAHRETLEVAATHLRGNQILNALGDPGSCKPVVRSIVKKIYEQMIMSRVETSSIEAAGLSLKEFQSLLWMADVQDLQLAFEDPQSLLEGCSSEALYRASNICLSVPLAKRKLLDTLRLKITDNPQSEKDMHKFESAVYGLTSEKVREKQLSLGCDSLCGALIALLPDQICMLACCIVLRHSGAGRLLCHEIRDLTFPTEQKRQAANEATSTIIFDTFSAALVTLGYIITSSQKAGVLSFALEQMGILRDWSVTLGRHLAEVDGVTLKKRLAAIQKIADERKVARGRKRSLFLFAASVADVINYDSFWEMCAIPCLERALSSVGIPHDFVRHIVTTSLVSARKDGLLLGPVEAFVTIDKGSITHLRAMCDSVGLEERFEEIVQGCIHFKLIKLGVEYSLAESCASTFSLTRLNEVVKGLDVICFSGSKCPQSGGKLVLPAIQQVFDLDDDFCEVILQPAIQTFLFSIGSDYGAIARIVKALTLRSHRGLEEEFEAVLFPKEVGKNERFPALKTLCYELGFNKTFLLTGIAQPALDTILLRLGVRCEKVIEAGCKIREVNTLDFFEVFYSLEPLFFSKHNSSGCLEALENICRILDLGNCWSICIRPALRVALDHIGVDNGLIREVLSRFQRHHYEQLSSPLELLIFQTDPIIGKFDALLSICYTLKVGQLLDRVVGPVLKNALRTVGVPYEEVDHCCPDLNERTLYTILSPLEHFAFKSVGFGTLTTYAALETVCKKMGWENQMFAFMRRALGATLHEFGVDIKFVSSVLEKLTGKKFKSVETHLQDIVFLPDSGSIFDALGKVLAALSFWTVEDFARRCFESCLVGLGLDVMLAHEYAKAITPTSFPKVQRYLEVLLFRNADPDSINSIHSMVDCLNTMEHIWNGLELGDVSNMMVRPAIKQTLLRLNVPEARANCVSLRLTCDRTRYLLLRPALEKLIFAAASSATGAMSALKLLSEELQEPFLVRDLAWCVVLGIVSGDVMCELLRQGVDALTPNKLQMLWIVVEQAVFVGGNADELSGFVREILIPQVFKVDSGMQWMSAASDAFSSSSLHNATSQTTSLVSSDPEWPSSAANCAEARQSVSYPKGVNFFNRAGSLHMSGASMLTKNYPIFSIFRSQSVHQILQDSYAIYLISTFLTWDEVTRKLLLSIHSQAYTVWVTPENGGAPYSSIELRLTRDPRERAFQGTHSIVAVVALIGLVLWSVLFPTGVYLNIRRNQKELFAFESLRLYGYFHSGIQSRYYYWELMVKTFDKLVMYIVAFTPALYNTGAKLVAYSFITLFFAAFYHYHSPYDGRQNFILSQAEEWGFRTRSFTFGVLAVLLIIDSPMALSSVVACSIFLVNLIYALVMLLLIGGEVVGTTQRILQQNKERLVGTKVLRRVTTTTTSASVHHLSDRQLLSVSKRGLPLIIVRFVGKVLDWFQNRLLFMFTHVAGTIQRQRKNDEQLVPHVFWSGHNRDIFIAHYHSDKTNLVEAGFSSFVKLLYRLGSSEQLEYISRTISMLQHHFLAVAKFKRLPSASIDVIYTLPVALRRISNMGDDCNTALVVERICDLFYDADKLGQKTYNKSTSKAWEDTFKAQGGDVFRAMMWIQKARLIDINALLAIVRCHYSEGQQTQARHSGTSHHEWEDSSIPASRLRLGSVDVDGEPSEDYEECTFVDDMLDVSLGPNDDEAFVASTLIVFPDLFQLLTDEYDNADPRMSTEPIIDSVQIEVAEVSSFSTDPNMRYPETQAESSVASISNQHRSLQDLETCLRRHGREERAQRAQRHVELEELQRELKELHKRQNDLARIIGERPTTAVSLRPCTAQSSVITTDNLSVSLRLSSAGNDSMSGSRCEDSSATLQMCKATLMRPPTATSRPGTSSRPKSAISYDSVQEIPHEFLCPIGHEVILEPVSTCDGYTYERDNIESWLTEHNTSPVTGLILASKDLIPNITLQTLIQNLSCVDDLGEDSITFYSTTLLAMEQDLDMPVCRDFEERAFLLQAQIEEREKNEHQECIYLLKLRAKVSALSALARGKLERPSELPRGPLKTVSKGKQHDQTGFKPLLSQDNAPLRFTKPPSTLHPTSASHLHLRSNKSLAPPPPPRFVNPPEPCISNPSRASLVKSSSNVAEDETEDKTLVGR